MHTINYNPVGNPVPYREIAELTDNKYHDRQKVLLERTTNIMCLYIYIYGEKFRLCNEYPQKGGETHGNGSGSPKFYQNR